MTEGVTPQESLCRVENALRQWKQHRQNQEHILFLLTTLSDALEGTKFTSLDVCRDTASSSLFTTLSSFSSSDESDTLSVDSHKIMTALNGVQQTLTRSQYAVSSALTRLSCRIQSIEGRVQHICNISKKTIATMQDRLKSQWEQRILKTIALAVWSNIVRLSYEHEEATEEEMALISTTVASSHVPSFCITLRENWQKEEQIFSLALQAAADVYESTAYISCRLLRASLLKMFLSQRWFPSPQIHKLRREGRFAWYCEMNEVNMQRSVAQKVKWERHEKMAGLLTEGELLYEK